MKNIYNISQILKKILVIVLLVVSLTACEQNGDLIGEKTCETNDANSIECTATKDTWCLGCSIFTLMFNAVSANIMKLHGQLNSGAMALMMIGFSIWLVIRLLKFVSSVSESSISQIWNEIIKQAFLCLFCGILASSPAMLIYTVNTFVYPIYVTFLKIGIAIMESAVSNSSGAPSTFELFGETINVGQVNIVCTFEKSGIITQDGFPKEFLNAIVCMIRVLTEYLGVGSQISHDLMRQNASYMGMITGFFLMCFFWVVRIGFVFYLVDTIFQMGIIILLLPIFIMSYAFKTTRSWAGKAFTNLLSSAAFLMCFSMIVTLVLRAMVELIAKNPNVFDPENKEFEMANLGIGFMCLILIGFLIYESMGVTQQIAGSLIGGGGKNEFQKNLVKALDKVKGWGLKILSSAVSFGASLLPASIQEKIHKIENLRKEVNALAGRDK